MCAGVGSGAGESVAEITAYGCGAEEANLFRATAERRGVVVRVIEAPVSEANAALARGSRCVSVGHRAPISNSTLRALRGVGVQYISTRSTGRNHLDVDFAQRLGIRVEGVTYSPGGVADYTLMLMLMALRRARSILLGVEVGDFRVQGPRGRELQDLTVGVIGTGRIGTAVIERLRGFGCAVLAYDHRMKTRVEYVGLDELFSRSDIVTLHTPLTSETRHLVNGKRIGRMKAGALIVNTGRGGLVDTEALLVAIEGGHLGGAALDVLEGEEGVFYVDHRDTPIRNPLVPRLQRLPNVVLTPHTAYYTEQALFDTVQNTLLNCLEFERTHA